MIADFMNNKEISKVIDSNLPSNIDFTFLEEELTIVLGKCRKMHRHLKDGYFA